MVVTWIVVMVLAGLTLVALGVYAWRRRTTSGALSFGLLMFSIAIWSLAYALEVLSQGLSAKMLWIKAEYVGIAAMPALWLAFALQYTGRGRWLSRRNVALLAVIPLSTVLLVWTNEVHHLFYHLTTVDWSSGWPLLHIEYGPGFWGNALFSYVCMSLGTLLLAAAFFRSSALYRGQTGVLLLGALIPWAGNAAYLAGLVPWPDLDPTPLAFALSGVVLAYGLFRYRLLRIVPVARQAVVEGMPAAMIVLDAEGHIADLNPAARQLFHLTDKEAIGRSARQVLWPAALVDRFAAVPQVDTELEWEEGDERWVCRVTISPLDDGTSGIPARLILISDITEQAQAKESLAQANRRLLALQESTAALTALLDPAELFEQVMDQVESFMPSHYAVLGLWDEAAERLTLGAHRGFSLEAASETVWTPFQQLPDWVVRHKAPLLVKDDSSDLEGQSGDGRCSGSLLLVPILYQEQCLGVLGLFAPELEVYTPADRDFLLAFANQVAIALDNARLYEQEQARRRLADTLQEVGRILNTALALDQVLELLMEQLARVVGYQGATVALLRDGRLECVVARGFADPTALTAFSLDVRDNAIFQQIVATNAPVIIADVSQDPRWKWVAGVEFTRAWIGAPLEVKGRIIGQLSIYHARPGYYRPEDSQTLLAFARQAAVAIENARLHEETTARADAMTRQNRHLALLHEIARVAASTLDFQTLYQVLADTLAQIIGGDGCYITRIDETSSQVLGGAAYGPFRDSYRELHPPSGEVTLTESVLKAGRPLAVEDVFHSPYLSPRIAEMFPARSMLGLPLRLGERDLGAVLIAFNQPHTFRDEEVTWATQAVALAALALENARLFQIVEQGKREWEVTFDAMPDLIALLDREYRIVRANKAMADRLGIEIAEAVGSICYEGVHGMQQPSPFCPYARLLADGQPHTEEVHEDRLGGDFLVSVSPLHDAGGELIGAVHVAHDITARKRAETERERLIDDLQEALAKIKTLRGLVPICANCKKIRDDQGYWHSVEVYVREHSEAEFSHGICPDCMKELYPWFEEGKE